MNTGLEVNNYRRAKTLKNAVKIEYVVFHKCITYSPSAYFQNVGERKKERNEGREDAADCIRDSGGHQRQALGSIERRMHLQLGQHTVGQSCVNTIVASPDINGCDSYARTGRLSSAKAATRCKLARLFCVLVQSGWKHNQRKNLRLRTLESIAKENINAAVCVSGLRGSCHA